MNDSMCDLLDRQRQAEREREQAALDAMRREWLRRRDQKNDQRRRLEGKRVRGVRR